MRVSDDIGTRDLQSSNDTTPHPMRPTTPPLDTVGLPRHFALLLLIAGGASLVSKNGYTLTGRRDTDHRLVTPTTESKSVRAGGCDPTPRAIDA